MTNFPSQEEITHAIMKVWGTKWIEFAEINKDPTAPERKDQDFRYSSRLDAQDAALGVLRLLQRRDGALTNGERA